MKKSIFSAVWPARVAVAIHNSQLYEETSRQASALEKANLVREDFWALCPTS